MLPPEERLERLETLVARGASNDSVARAALLGTVKRPAFPWSKLFEEYEAMTKDEVKDFSRNQLRVWRNSRVALAAMKLRPQGFPRYRDKSSSLSATVNKFLRVNGLRPTKDHSVYSLRHSFKDRLVAAEAPDSLIDSLMGHKTYKPKYGKGPSLELKLKYLQQIAFKPPALA